MRYKAIIVLMFATMTVAGCATTQPASSAAPTPQQVIAYATPWIQAATVAASAVEATGAVKNKNLSTAVTVANAVLAAYQATPTATNQAALEAAMQPVYAGTVAATGTSK